jgi:VCBS repeat-containing protein
MRNTRRQLSNISKQATLFTLASLALATAIYPILRPDPKLKPENANFNLSLIPLETAGPIRTLNIQYSLRDNGDAYRGIIGLPFFQSYLTPSIGHWYRWKDIDGRIEEIESRNSLAKIGPTVTNDPNGDRIVTLLSGSKFTYHNGRLVCISDGKWVYTFDESRPGVVTLFISDGLSQKALAVLEKDSGDRAISLLVKGQRIQIRYDRFGRMVEIMRSENLNQISTIDYTNGLISHIRTGRLLYTFIWTMPIDHHYDRPLIPNAPVLEQVRREQL